MSLSIDAKKATCDFDYSQVCQKKELHMEPFASDVNGSINIYECV